MFDILKRALADSPSNAISRRTAMALPAALPVAGLAAAPSSAFAAATSPAPGIFPPAEGRVESSFFSYDDPIEKMTAEFRIYRDLADEADVLLWYHFTMFIVAEGRKVEPVVRYEGIEFSHHKRIDTHVYRVHGHNTSYPRHPVTGEFVETVLNPVTGKTVKVDPTILTEDPGMLYGPGGKRPLDREGADFTPTSTIFHIEDDVVKAEQIRVPPDNWFTPFIETSHNWTVRALFDDLSITRLPMGTAGGYVFPYPSWVDMGEIPGHMFAIWSGKKLDGVHQLPAEYYDRIERDNPELMAVNLEPFSRPI